MDGTRRLPCDLIRSVQLSSLSSSNSVSLHPTTVNLHYCQPVVATDCWQVKDGVHVTDRILSFPSLTLSPFVPSSRVMGSDG